MANSKGVDPTTNNTSPNPGDLGRRIASRREAVGISTAELADRADIAEPYLRHLESDPDATPEVRTVWKLARALDTTTAFLMGTDISHAPGTGSPGAARELSAINAEECWSLLGSGGIGRLVFESERGPTALPVNFKLLGRSIVVMVEPGGHFDGLLGQERVGFEVDSIDDVLREGWSVLVTGRTRSPGDDEESAAVNALGVRPWAGGQRDKPLILDATEITGRRVSGPR